MTDIRELNTKMQSLKVDERPFPDYEGIDLTTPKGAMAASLHLLFNHVSDFHKLMVRILSEKYKIPVEDMMKTIIEHPDYNTMQVHPIVYSMGFFTQEDADKALETEEPAPKRAKMDEDKDVSLPVKRKLKIVKKK